MVVVVISKQAQHQTFRHLYQSKHVRPPPPPPPPTAFLLYPHYHPPPSWSVRTLLPSSDPPSTKSTPTISPSTLAHLLRLSALPPPADPASLHDHLHFVRYLTKVKTFGVVPVAAIRDEVRLAGRYSYEDVMGTEKQLDDAGVSEGGDVSWNAVERAKRKVGSFFVVDEAVEDELVRPEVEK